MAKKNEGLTVVVLAAGKGTRMKSSKAKVLHEVFFRPMLHHVLDAVVPLQPERIVVIVGHQRQAVEEALQDYDVVFVHQQEQLGTGHAVLITRDVIPEDAVNVLILCGDTPLISHSSLEQMSARHNQEDASLTVMTTRLQDPFGYGRILSEQGKVVAIVEEKECTPLQRKIDEINSGIYLVGRKLLFEALRTVTPENSQGEFYLTDIVKYAVLNGAVVDGFCCANAMEVLGVNSRVELEAAHTVLRRRKNRELMQAGVSLHHSETTTVAPFSEVGGDTLIMPGVSIYGTTSVGRGCILEDGVVLKDCRIGDHVHIGTRSVLSNCSVPDGATVTAGTVKDASPKPKEGTS